MDKSGEAFMISLNGQPIRTDIMFVIEFKSYERMQKQFFDRVKEHLELSDGSFLREKKQMKVLMLLNSMNRIQCPLKNGFLLGISKLKLNDFLIEIDGFFSNNTKYQGADSSDILEKHWAVPDRKETFAEDFGQKKTNLRMAVLCKYYSFEHLRLNMFTNRRNWSYI